MWYIEYNNKALVPNFLGSAMNHQQISHGWPHVQQVSIAYRFTKKWLNFMLAVDRPQPTSFHGLGLAVNKIYDTKHRHKHSNATYRICWKKWVWCWLKPSNRSLGEKNQNKCLRLLQYNISRCITFKSIFSFQYFPFSLFSTPLIPNKDIRDRDRMQEIYLHSYVFA